VNKWVARVGLILVPVVFWLVIANGQPVVIINHFSREVNMVLFVIASIFLLAGFLRFSFPDIWKRTWYELARPRRFRVVDDSEANGPHPVLELQLYAVQPGKLPLKCLKEVHYHVRHCQRCMTKVCGWRSFHRW
jgi:hypothetical protein